VAGLWLRRSRATRIRVIAVAGVLALYAVVKFAPVPGVPCQISEARECAPEDDVVALVPEDALLYAHVTLDEDTTQFDRADEFAGRLSNVRLLVEQLASSVWMPFGSPLELGRDVMPWADRDLAIALLTGPGNTTEPLFLAGVGDRAQAETFLETIAPPGPRQEREHKGAPLTLYGERFASAFAGDRLLLGEQGAVRGALDVDAGDAPDLGAGQTAVRDELPEARLAEVYLSRQGVRRLLAGRRGGATQLETFVNYGATDGVAAAAVAREEGVEIRLVSRLDSKRLEQSPGFFGELPEFEPELAGEAGSRALGYVGVGDLGPTLTELLGAAGGDSELISSLRRLSRSLEQEAGVDPLRQLLPALSGEAALTAEPTDAIPFASLIVEGVDEKRATAALGRLELPVVRALAAPGRGRVPRFEEREVEGVTARSVEISPALTLTYAVFDGMLVVSTDPAGIAQVRSGSGSLAGADHYEAITDELPDEVAALVFLNLDELLGLAEEAGLAEDPLYASLSDDISKVRSLGLAVRGEDDELRSELFLTID
jgi:hypothetical protein